MELISNLLATGFGVVILAFAAFWLLCMTLAPIFWYNTARHAKSIDLKLSELIELQSSTRPPQNKSRKQSAKPAPESVDQPRRVRDAIIQEHA